MTVDLTALLTSGAALTVLVGGIAAALVAIRRWIRTVAEPAQRAAEQTATSNGRTAGQLVERVAREMGQVARDVSALTELAAENRDLALSARALAEQANARLDAHLIGHKEG